MSALDLGPIPLFAQYAQDGLMQGGFLFKAVSGKISNDTTNAVNAIHYLALVAALVGGLSMVLMRSLQTPGTILSWLLLVTVTVVGPLHHPILFRMMSIQIGDTQQGSERLQNYVFAPQAEVVNIMSQVHRAIFAALFDITDEGKPKVRNFTDSFLNADGVGVSPGNNFNEQPAALHLVQLYKTMCNPGMYDEYRPLYDHQYAQNYDALYRGNYTGNIDSLDPTWDVEHLNNQQTYRLQNKVFTLADVYNKAIPSYNAMKTSEGKHAPFAVYYLEEGNFVDAYHGAGIDGMDGSTRNSPRVAQWQQDFYQPNITLQGFFRAWQARLHYLMVPWEDLTWGNDSDLPFTTPRTINNYVHPDNSMPIEQHYLGSTQPIMGAAPGLEYHDGSDPNHPLGTIKAGTGRAPVPITNSLYMGFADGDDIVDSDAMAVHAIAPSGKRYGHESAPNLRTDGTRDDFPNDDERAAFENLAEYHNLPVGLGLVLDGYRSGDTKTQVAVVHSCAQLHQLTHLRLKRATMSENSWGIANRQTGISYIREVGSPEAIHRTFISGKSSDQFDAEIEHRICVAGGGSVAPQTGNCTVPQLDDTVKVKPNIEQVHGFIKSQMATFGKADTAGGGSGHVLDQPLSQDQEMALAELIHNRLIISAMMEMNRYTDKGNLMPPSIQNAGVNNAIQYQLSGDHVQDVLDQRQVSNLAGIIGQAASWISDYGTQIKAEFTGAEAVVYIKWIQMLTGLALFLALIITPLYFVVGILIPKHAVGVLINSILVVAVLKAIPITYTIVDFAISYAINASALLQSGVEEALMVYVIAGAYTSTAAITLFLLFKAGDTNQLIGNIANLDAQANRIADASVDFVEGVAKKAAIATGAAVGVGALGAAAAAKAGGAKAAFGGAAQQMKEAAGSLPFVGKFAGEMTNAWRQGSTYGAMDAKAREQAQTKLTAAQEKLDKGQVKYYKSGAKAGQVRQSTLGGYADDNERKALEMQRDEYQKIVDGGARTVMDKKRRLDDGAQYFGALGAVQADIRTESAAMQWRGKDSYDVEQGKLDDQTKSQYRAGKATVKQFEEFVESRAEQIRIDNPSITLEDAKVMAKLEYDTARYSADEADAIQNFANQFGKGQAMMDVEATNIIARAMQLHGRKANVYSGDNAHEALAKEVDEATKANVKGQLGQAFNKPVMNGSRTDKKTGVLQMYKPDAHHEITADHTDMNKAVIGAMKKEFGKKGANVTTSVKIAEAAAARMASDIADGEIKLDVPPELKAVKGLNIDKIASGNLKSMQVTRADAELFGKVEGLYKSKFDIDISPKEGAVTLDAYILNSMKKNGNDVVQKYIDEAIVEARNAHRGINDKKANQRNS